MRHYALFRRVVALLIMFGMSGGYSLPAWAGPECPHAHAAAHSRHQVKHHSHGFSGIAVLNADKPCKCDEHAGMTMADCVALAIGLGLPTGTQILPAHQLQTGFALPAVLIHDGMAPELDPYPPKPLPIA